jgi:predicted amino acid-binding ACT domain protein
LPFWQYKIGRLRKDVTEADISSYLNDHGIDVINIEKLRSRSDSSISMHIEVPHEAKDRVMSSEFWFKGIRVIEWRFRYNNRRVSGNY